MKEIIRIAIKGCSGYGPYELAYKDKLTLTPTSIAYEYVPELESESNSLKRWKYSTNSIDFRTAFSRISELAEKVFESDLDAELVTDVGFTEFIITYSDKTKKSAMFWTSGEQFAEMFTLIGQLIPRTEDIPEVIK